MASIESVMAGRSGGAEEIVRVGGDRVRPTLGVLLTGVAAPHDPAVEQFLHFTQAQGLDLSELYALLRGGEPVAAALVVPSRGRTGMFFCSPARGRVSLDQHAELIRVAADAQEPERTSLIQALLDPFQRAERQALRAAGFQTLATLVYMQRATQSFNPPPPENLGDPTLRVHHYDHAARPLFAEAILASYVETLDCPRLLGMRAIDDIIDGHMATGRFDPSLWYAYYQEGRPAGVMLLSEIPQRGAAELVYLGVSKPFRGRGLARRMLNLALDVSARRGFKSLLLAVDEENTPALRLYRGLAFRPTARKTALVCPVS